MKELLPPIFKLIGKAMIGVGALGFLGTILIVGGGYYPLEQLPVSKQVYWTLLQVPFILGLFFMNWSREESDDEMQMQMRHKALSRAFTGGIMLWLVSILLNPVFNGFHFGNNLGAFNQGSSIILFMLAYYHFFRKGGKDQLEKELHEE